ncbi:hypothetical protein KIW84_030447 [Lathyrus oleraceus]|uniref:Retrotransposon gag domain-containing protein n=1 Tax=Pisum sativum TaxID=3888 RepID=A0A9D5AZG1_PEA|nr:hypothetical protein KIW84_030447 [Pisum sativum]
MLNPTGGQDVCRTIAENVVFPITGLQWINHGEQPQPESGVGRGNGGGRGNGVREEPPMVINNGSNDGNNGNRNDIVFGDSYSNIDGNDQEGSSYSLKVRAVAGPATGDPRYKQWKSENSLIIPWLVSSMGTGIGKPYMFLHSAKNVWEAVKETYFDIQNSSQIFGLKSKLWHAKQGDRSVTAYYNELLTLWQELDLCYDDNWRCIEDSVLFLNRQENDSVFMFLAGFNKDLDEVRGRVLGKVSLSTLRETFVEIRRGEARQGIMMGKTPRNSESEGSALATRNLDEGRRSDKASNSDQGQQPPPSQFPLTTEQLDRLYKLLESPTPSCSIATKGNSVFLNVSPSHTWIVDSGASDHMTGESTLFSSYSPCAGFELGEDDWQC